jgi:iron complex outermembrane receptor protein
MSRFSIAARRGRLLTTTALALAGSPSLAQQATALPPIAVESAPIQGGLPDGPLASSTLSSAAMAGRRSETSDTARLLSALPGVSAYGAGGFSSLPTIHGLGDDRVSILVDGVPVDDACPNHMNPPLSYTDPQTVRQVSVIAGVAPVSLGGDSLGGVIAVDTAEPRFAKAGQTLLDGEVSSFYRSNGAGAGGALTATAASEALSLTYAGSFSRSSDYRGGGGAGQVRSSEYEKTDHAVTLAARTDAGLFQLQGGLQWSPYEGFPNQYMDMTFNRSWYANFRYQGVFNWGDLDARAYYRDTRHKMNFLSDKGGAADGGMPMNTEGRTAGYVLKADIPLSARDTLRIGDEFHHEQLNDEWPPVAGSAMMGPNTFVNVNHAHRDRMGVFAEWEAKWNERWSTQVGARGDVVSMNTGQVQPYSTGMMGAADAVAAKAFNAVDHARSYAHFDATALVRYASGDNTALEFGYAHKTRSPNIYERYAWGRGSMSSRMIGWFGDGNGYVGNLDLKPEVADMVSAAAELRASSGRPWTVRIAPYYTRVHDYIDVNKLADLTDAMGRPTGFVQFQFANREAEFYGVDLSGSIQLWNTAGSGRADLKGVLSWVRGQNTDGGASLYHQMPLNAQITLEHSLGPWESAADLVLVTDKTRVDAPRNEPRTAGYALVNLHTSYTWRKLRLDLGVENLFDTAYAQPLSGLSLGDYRATGVLRPVPGRGRSFNVGLGVKF